MGHSFLYARQNTGLLWHTAVRPSVHASYDNTSHLFPLLLIGHVVTYIVLIKREQVRGVILVSLENASFHMVHVYTINWFKKVQNDNYCSHAAQPTFNFHKRGGGGAYHGTVVYFLIFRCCFFPWCKGSVRDNSFNRNFLYMRLS
jgi:hypothetical protein